MAIGRRITDVDITKFVGGVNYSQDVISLEKTESPNAINVDFDGEIIGKRKGFSEVNATPTGSSDRCNSLFDFGVEGTGRYLISHFNQTVYRMTNLNGTLTQIRSSAPNVISYNSKIKQYLVQTYSDNSAPYYWDGVSSSMAVLSASAPGFKYTIEAQGYLLGANISTARLRIFYQDINTMVGGAYVDYLTLTGGRDDEITGLFTLNGRIYASTKTSLFRLSYIGGVAVFEYKQVISSVGAVPRTIQIVVSEEFGEIALFLGHDLRIYLFDGSFIRDVSKKYKKPNNDTIVALDYIDNFRITNSSSVFDFNKNVYRLAITLQGDETNDFMINIDVRNFAYYPYSRTNFHSMAIAEDMIGRRYLIGGDYSGKLHKLFGNYNHDNGRNIVEFYESPPLLLKINAMSKSDSLQLIFAPTANYKLTLDDRTDFDKTWKERASLNMFNTRDRFIGQNTNLGNSFSLGSDNEMVFHSVGVPVMSNLYRFRLRSKGTENRLVQYITGTVAGSGGGTTLTGTGTDWKDYMIPGNGYKIVIFDGVHKNYVYDFTYVSGTSATVSTMQGTAPTNNFTGASYAIFSNKEASSNLGWRLINVNLNSQALTIGKAEPVR